VGSDSCLRQQFPSVGPAGRRALSSSPSSSPGRGSSGLGAANEDPAIGEASYPPLLAEGGGPWRRLPRTGRLAWESIPKRLEQAGAPPSVRARSGEIKCSFVEPLLTVKSKNWMPIRPATSRGCFRADHGDRKPVICARIGHDPSSAATPRFRRHRRREILPKLATTRQALFGEKAAARPHGFSWLCARPCRPGLSICAA